MVTTESVWLDEPDVKIGFTPVEPTLVNWIFVIIGNLWMLIVYDFFVVPFWATASKVTTSYLPLTEEFKTNVYSPLYTPLLVTFEDKLLISPLPASTLILIVVLEEAVAGKVKFKDKVELFNVPVCEVPFVTVTEASVLSLTVLSTLTV